MKPMNKWISTAAVALVMLLVLYYAGVVHSKMAVGIPVTAMSGILLLSVFLTPRTEMNNTTTKQQL